MAEQEGLGDVVAHEDLERPCAVGCGDEPRARGDAPDGDGEARAVGLGAESAVEAEGVAGALADGDARCAHGAARGLGLGGGLGGEPREEAVGVGDERARARVHEAAVGLLERVGVADPARLHGLGRAHALLRLLPWGSGCSCRRRRGGDSVRRRCEVCIVVRQRACPSGQLLAREHRPQSSQGRQRTRTRSKRGLGQPLDRRPRPPPDRVGRADQRMGAHAARAPSSEGTATLIGVGLAVVASVLIAAGLNTQRCASRGQSGPAGRAHCSLFHPQTRPSQALAARRTFLVPTSRPTSSPRCAPTRAHAAHRHDQAHPRAQPLRPGPRRPRPPASPGRPPRRVGIPAALASAHPDQEGPLDLETQKAPSRQGLCAQPAVAPRLCPPQPRRVCQLSRVWLCPALGRRSRKCCPFATRNTSQADPGPQLGLTTLVANVFLAPLIVREVRHALFRVRVQPYSRHPPAALPTKRPPRRSGGDSGWGDCRVRFAVQRQEGASSFLSHPHRQVPTLYPRSSHRMSSSPPSPSRSSSRTQSSAAPA